MDSELYFKVGQYKLSSNQKKYLDKFSSKLISFLDRYRENINTLEVNGHTSSEWGGTDFTSNYLKNEQLSMNRSYSTLEFIFRNQDLKKQAWLTEIIKGSGLSYSKKIMRDANEYREKSLLKLY